MTSTKRFAFVVDDVVDIDVDIARGQVYIIQEREFALANEPVYKLGRSSNFQNRVKAYPKGSTIHFVASCADCVTAERELLYVLGQLFVRCPRFGNEYFYGSVYDIVRIVGKYFFNYPEYAQILKRLDSNSNNSNKSKSNSNFNSKFIKNKLSYRK